MPGEQTRLDRSSRGRSSMPRGRSQPRGRRTRSIALKVREHMLARESPRPSPLPAVTNASGVAGGLVGEKLRAGNSDILLSPRQMRHTYEFIQALEDPAYAKTRGITARQIGPETSLRNAEKILTEFTTRVFRDALAALRQSHARGKKADATLNAIIGAAAPGQDPHAMDFNRSTHPMVIHVAPDRTHTVNLTLPLRASSVMFRVGLDDSNPWSHEVMCRALHLNPVTTDPNDAKITVPRNMIEHLQRSFLISHTLYLGHTLTELQRDSWYARLGSHVSGGEHREMLLRRGKKEEADRLELPTCKYPPLLTQYEFVLKGRTDVRAHAAPATAEILGMLRRDKETLGGWVTRIYSAHVALMAQGYTVPTQPAMQHLALQTVDREVYSDKKIVGDDLVWYKIQKALYEPLELKRIICDQNPLIQARDRNTATFYFERRLMDRDLIMSLAAPPLSELRKYQDARIGRTQDSRARRSDRSSGPRARSVKKQSCAGSA